MAGQPGESDKSTQRGGVSNRPILLPPPLSVSKFTLLEGKMAAVRRGLQENSGLWTVSKISRVNRFVIFFYSGIFPSCIEELSLDQTEQLVWQHAHELRKIFEGKVNRYFWRRWWSVPPNRLWRHICSEDLHELLGNEFRTSSVSCGMSLLPKTKYVIFHCQIGQSQQMHTFKWGNITRENWYMQQALRPGKSGSASHSWLICFCFRLVANK